MCSDPDGHQFVHFSTLESYHGDGDAEGDRFVFATHKLGSSSALTQEVDASVEARSYAFASGIGRYVLGASLDPQIFLFDPATNAIDTLWRGPSSLAWLHGIAVDATHAYTVLSTPGNPVRNYEGILKVNLRTGREQLIPFTDQMEQGWAGAETVDPTGRIWFYRAYPLKRLWYDPVGGMRERLLPGYEGWTVEAWDSWRGKSYVTLTSPDRRFLKRPLNLATLTPLPEDSPTDESTMLFLETIRVDLHHQDHPSSGVLYFHPGSSTFYRRELSAGGEDSLTLVGTANLGQLDLVGYHSTPQERAVRWNSPGHGEVEVLGLTLSKDLLVWLRGRKSYIVYKTAETEHPTVPVTIHDISVSNISPAEITALASATDGYIYGGGILTMSHMFRFDPSTNSTSLLKGAIPHAEGQINALFTGRDGKIYGAGYPDSVIFQFDPSKPWDPGSSAHNNPRNLGPLGHYRQMRAYRGVQDLRDVVWFESVSDYHSPEVRALARADFHNGSLRARTTQEAGFPAVSALTIFDDDHLLLLGQYQGDAHLYLLDQSTMATWPVRRVARHDGVLASVAADSNGVAQLFLSQGADLFEISRDFSLRHVHKSVKPIARIIPSPTGALTLIGKTHVDLFIPNTGVSEVWWNGDDVPSQYLFRNLSWVPAVFHGGDLFFAQDAKLMRLDRTGC